MNKSALVVINNCWSEILASVKEDLDLSFREYCTWLEQLRLTDVLENENKVVINVPLEKQGINYIAPKYTIILRIKIEEFTGFRCDDIIYVSEANDEQGEVLKSRSADDAISSADDQETVIPELEGAPTTETMLKQMISNNKHRELFFRRRKRLNDSLVKHNL